MNVKDIKDIKDIIDKIIEMDPNILSVIKITTVENISPYETIAINRDYNMYLNWNGKVVILSSYSKYIIIDKKDYELLFKTINNKDFENLLNFI